MDSAAPMALASHPANIVTDCTTVPTAQMSSTVVSLLPGLEELEALVVVSEECLSTKFSFFLQYLLCLALNQFTLSAGSGLSG